MFPFSPGLGKVGDLLDRHVLAGHRYAVQPDQPLPGVPASPACPGPSTGGTVPSRALSPLQSDSVRTWAVVAAQCGCQRGAGAGPLAPQLPPWKCWSEREVQQTPSFLLQLLPANVSRKRPPLYSDLSSRTRPCQCRPPATRHFQTTLPWACWSLGDFPLRGPASH